MPSTAVRPVFARAGACAEVTATAVATSPADATDKRERFIALQYRIVGSPPIDRVLAEVDRAADEIVAFTADLVRIPTINPPGEEYEACAHFLGDQLRRRAFEVEYIA